MARGSFARDARKLCFGNADRLSIRQSGILLSGRPEIRHSTPLVLTSGEA
jgi:hypothetical protein